MHRRTPPRSTSTSTTPSLTRSRTSHSARSRVTWRSRPATHNVKVYATDTTESPVIDADVTVAAGAKYTIAATDAVASISAQVLQDEPAPDCEGASVRVVHFSADAPAVDVAVTGSDPADAVVKNLEYPNATDYVALPAGSYDLEVRLAGTTTVALPLPGVAVEDCNAYSVFAIGSAASPAVGDNALQVVVAVDATASEEAGRAPPPTDTVTPDVPSGSSGIPAPRPCSLASWPSSPSPSAPDASPHAACGQDEG